MRHLCLLIFLSCAPVKTIKTEAPSLPQRITLGAGDTIVLKIYREPDLSGSFVLDNEGRFNYPLLGRIDANKKTPEDLRALLQRRLEDGYLKRAEISISVKAQSARKVHVLGQVKKAGSFSFTSGMSIIEAISLAGDFTSEAAPGRVVVTRASNGRRYTIDASDIREGEAPNFVLEAGDIVFVPEFLL